MPYESFTFQRLQADFGLDVVQVQDSFDTIAPAAPSEWLRTTIRLALPLIVGRSSEKARSELLVMPILLEVREKVNQQVAIFSGIKFNVSRQEDLYGFCDFLISRDPLVFEVNAPVVTIVEAKREDLSVGLPQCIAEMVAAQKFNENRGKPLEVVYGATSSGTNWRFLQLRDKTVTVDLREYVLTEIEQIVGILVHMVS